MHEFSDRRFYAGSLTGIRSFAFDHLGRLTGVSVKEVWRPGENAAVCKRQTATARAALSGLLPSIPRSWLPGSPSYPSYYYYWADDPIIATRTDRPRTPPVSLVKKPKHQVAQKDCECGFWAYFEKGSNPHHISGNLFGVIEGYGVMTVGSKGFRAEKAKIVALAIPDWKREGAVLRVMHNYPDVAIFERRRDMLAEFPLTTPADFPTPDTDPDFWTRSAS